MNANGTESGRRYAPACGLRPTSERDGDRLVVVEGREHFRRLLAAAQARRPATACVERDRSAGVTL